MALDAATAADAIMAGYRRAVAIDEEGRPTGRAPEGSVAAAFASGYHDYASAGVVLGAASGGGDPSIIEGFMDGATSNSPAEIAAFALALATYWSGVAVTPGVPSHGGTAVTLVVNDALAKVSLFQAAISASITDEASEPGFLALVENIETMAVSAIVWMVTELLPPSGTPTVFPEGIL